jgi:hypothetical protein
MYLYQNDFYNCPEHLVQFNNNRSRPFFERLLMQTL